jgi:hypothetical protein
MPSLVFTLDDGSSFSVELDSDLLTVGRHEDSMVTLPSPSVSNQHATVSFQDGQYVLQDLGSSNGTRVNGQIVTNAVLMDGDQIAFGDVPALFVGDEPVVVAPAVVIPEPEVTIPRPVVGIPDYSRPPEPMIMRPPRRSVPAPKASGDGCFNAFMIVGLFLAAFFIGLSIRHYSLTDRFLLNDAADALMKKFGRITIEKPEESER